VSCAFSLSLFSLTFFSRFLSGSFLSNVLFSYRSTDFLICFLRGSSSESTTGALRSHKSAWIWGWCHTWAWIYHRQINCFLLLPRFTSLLCRSLSLILLTYVPRRWAPPKAPAGSFFNNWEQRGGANGGGVQGIPAAQLHQGVAHDQGVARAWQRSGGAAWRWQAQI
jgi:hypothetical protein